MQYRDKATLAKALLRAAERLEEARRKYALVRSTETKTEMAKAHQILLDAQIDYENARRQPADKEVH